MTINVKYLCYIFIKVPMNNQVTSTYQTNIKLRIDHSYFFQCGLRFSLICFGSHWYQGCHGQFLASNAATVVAHQRRAASAALYSTESRQGLGFGGLASRGSPGYKMMLSYGLTINVPLVSNPSAHTMLSYVARNSNFSNLGFMLCLIYYIN